MPAYFESGFMVREPAWHGEGYVADRYPEDWDEARQWAGLTWEPEVRPVFGFDGDVEKIADRIKVADDPATPPAVAEEALRRIVEGFHELPNQQRIVRNDTGATLGITSREYQVITHAEMGEVVEALLDQPNVKYDTAGSVRGGAQVWALAYLDEPIQLPGDPSVTLPYLALTTRHDGSGALRAQSTSVRVVCANTFSAAEAEGDRNGTAFTFSHSRSWRDRIAEAKETITGVRREFAAYVELAEQLTALPVTAEQTEQFITAFIPAPPEGLISDRVRNNVEAARSTMRLILAGPTSDGIGGTAFGLVQAAGEYLDHYRAYRSMDSHYARQLLRPEPLKAKAVRLVRELVPA